MSAKRDSARPPGRRRLKKRADMAIRARCAQVGDAIHDWGIPLDRDTGISLVAMGLELLQELGATTETALKFCQTVLDTPAEEDPRTHTGGT